MRGILYVVLYLVLLNWSYSASATLEITLTFKTSFASYISPAGYFGAGSGDSLVIRNIKDANNDIFSYTSGGTEGRIYMSSETNNALLIEPNKTSKLIVLGGAEPSVIDIIQIEAVNFTIGNLAGCKLSTGQGAIISLENGAIIRQPAENKIRDKQCAAFSNGRVYCTTPRPKLFNLFYPELSDSAKAIELEMEGVVLSRYKSNLLMGCLFESKSNQLRCSSFDVDTAIAFYAWSFGVTIPEGDSLNYIGIYPDQHLVSVVESSNRTIHFVDAKTGAYKASISGTVGEGLSTGFYYTPSTSKLFFFDDSSIYIASLTGDPLTSIENCNEFEEAEETCSQCRVNFFPSKNNTYCYKEVDKEFYKVEWGAGSEQFVRVFWFLGNNFDEIRKHYDESNVFVVDENGDYNYYKELFELKDVTTPGDLLSNSFRYSINFKNSFGKQNIRFQFTHETDLRAKFGCPKLTFKRLDRMEIEDSFPNNWKQVSLLSEGAFQYLFFAIYVCFLGAKFVAVVISPYMKALRNNSFDCFWFARSIWSLELMIYSTFIGTNFKGLLSGLMKGVVSTYFNLIDIRGGLYLERNDSKIAMIDIFMGKFTERSVSPFIINQALYSSCLYILLFIASILPIGEFKKYISRMKIALLATNWVSFWLFSLTTFGTTSSQPRTLDVKYSWVLALLLDIMLLFDFFLIWRRTPKSNKNNSKGWISKMSDFIYVDASSAMIGFDLVQGTYYRFVKYKKKSDIVEQRRRNNSSEQNITIDHNSHSISLLDANKDTKLEGRLTFESKNPNWFYRKKLDKSRVRLIFEEFLLTALFTFVISYFPSYPTIQSLMLLPIFIYLTINTYVHRRYMDEDHMFVWITKIGECILLLVFIIVAFFFSLENNYKIMSLTITKILSCLLIVWIILYLVICTAGLAYRFFIVYSQSQNKKVIEGEDDFFENARRKRQEVIENQFDNSNAGLVKDNEVLHDSTEQNLNVQVN